MGTRDEAVLTSTHNLCFEKKYEKYQNFLSENFPFLVVKFSVYLNRRVFVMQKVTQRTPSTEQQLRLIRSKHCRRVNIDFTGAKSSP